MTEQEIFEQAREALSNLIAPHLRQMTEGDVWSFLLGLLIRDSLDRGTEPREIARRLNVVAVGLIESGAVIVDIKPEDQ